MRVTSIKANRAYNDQCTMTLAGQGMPVDGLWV